MRKLFFIFCYNIIFANNYQGKSNHFQGQCLQIEKISYWRIYIWDKYYLDKLSHYECPIQNDTLFAYRFKLHIQIMTQHQKKNNFFYIYRLINYEINVAFSFLMSVILKEFIRVLSMTLLIESNERIKF